MSKPAPITRSGSTSVTSSCSLPHRRRTTSLLTDARAARKYPRRCGDDKAGRNRIPPVDAVERAGEEFELNAGVLELAGEGHQLGGIAGQTLEFVDGEDDLLVGGGFLDVVRELESLLQLGPGPDAGRDLLGEDPLPQRPARTPTNSGSPRVASRPSPTAWRRRRMPLNVMAT